MAEPFASWADLQIMGHVHHVGYVSEVEMFGAKFLKVEPISPIDGTPQPVIFYRPESVYSLSPTTEEEIRQVIETGRQRAERRQQMLAPPRPVEIDEEAFLRPEAGTIQRDDEIPFAIGDKDDHDEDEEDSDGVAL